MAFEIEQEKKRIDWMSILIGLFVVLFIGGAVYYLFFSSNPLIETLVDRSNLEISTNELQKTRVEAGKDNVLNDPVFKSLRPQVAPMAESQAGRNNPFQPF